MTDIQPEPGVLLVAAPMLADPNFHRSVVLICEHTPDGSFGLIINRLLEATPADVINGMATYDGALLLGGPVQTDTLHFLHTFHDVEGASPVLDGVSWGGSFEDIQEIVQATDSGPHELRFFLGYAGWGAGQLDAEIAEGGWIMTQAVAGDVFSLDPERVWRQVLRRMGGDYAILANFPGDPRLN